MDFYAYTLLALLFYAIGEMLSKLYANHGITHYAVVAFICYAITTGLWFPALRLNKQLAVTTTLWTVGYIVIGVLVGVGVFGERLTALHALGVLFGAISMVMLCY